MGYDIRKTDRVARSQVGEVIIQLNRDGYTLVGINEYNDKTCTIFYREADKQR